MKKTVILSLLLLAILSSCTTTTQQGNMIRFANSLPGQCRFLGNIGCSRWCTESDVKNKAAGMGGNWVIPTTTEIAFGGYVSNGDAYNCPQTMSSPSLANRVEHRVKPMKIPQASRSPASTNSSSSCTSDIQCNRLNGETCAKPKRGLYGKCVRILYYEEDDLL